MNEWAAEFTYALTYYTSAYRLKGKISLSSLFPQKSQEKRNSQFSFLKSRKIGFFLPPTQSFAVVFTVTVLTEGVESETASYVDLG